MTDTRAPLTALAKDVELEFLTDDCGNSLAWYVRGHVSDDALTALYEDWHGEPPEGCIAREWWRWVPATAAERYEYGWAYRQTTARPMSRGAFKVTVLWLR